MNGNDSEKLSVTFNPPLFLQRQRWILDILRREAVESVLDIGCGEGTLLQCLTMPPQFKPPLSLSIGSPFVTGTIAEKHTDMYLKEIHGLDPHAATLGSAILITAPPSNDDLPFTGYNRWRTRDARWTPLEVSLWEGGFENINDDFKGDRFDAFVASEVIEHLTPALLPLFAPIILGYYRPRVVALTTPNFTYNQRFSRPGESSPTGYLDPTGRTDRVFRHDDHKFEWTVEEWTKFCNEAAADFGYDVEIGGVGLAMELDPWDRDSILGFASQVAAFRRRDSEPYNADAFKDTFTSTEKPVLRAKHVHLPHPLSLGELDCCPNLADIHQAVKDAMTELGEGSITFETAWKYGTVSLKCLGDIAALVRAFEPENLDDQEWSKLDRNKGWNSMIVWKNFVMPDDVLEPETNLKYLQGTEDNPPTSSEEEEIYDKAFWDPPIVPAMSDDESATAQVDSSGWEEPKYSWGIAVDKDDAWPGDGWGDDARHPTNSWASSPDCSNEIASVES